MKTNKIITSTEIITAVIIISLILLYNFVFPLLWSKADSKMVYQLVEKYQINTVECNKFIKQAHKFDWTIEKTTKGKVDLVWLLSNRYYIDDLNEDLKQKGYSLKIDASYCMNSINNNISLYINDKESLIVKWVMMTILLRQYQHEDEKINFIKKMDDKITHKEAEEMAKNFTIVWNRRVDSNVDSYNFCLNDTKKMLKTGEDMDVKNIDFCIGEFFNSLTNNKKGLLY